MFDAKAIEQAAATIVGVIRAYVSDDRNDSMARSTRDNAELAIADALMAAFTVKPFKTEAE